MAKKVMIATGGTGGHVYPAMSLARQLLREIDDIQLLFVGGALSENKYFNHEDFPYRSVQCATFAGRDLRKSFKVIAHILKGTWQSRRVIKEFKPDVAVGFGSYFAFPPLLAAKMLAVPIVLHESNSIPGKANRLMSKFATVTGVHFPETARLLSGPTVEVGTPLREGYKCASTPAADAKAHFGLVPQIPVLLVFGGSQGAKAINLLLLECAKLLRPGSLQVLHIAGEAEMAQSLQRAYDQAGIHAVVKPYEARMDLAWQAADLAITRAGAVTIAEQLEFEVPAILIPYPKATDNHQEQNAKFMRSTVGGAFMVREEGLSATMLKAHVESMLQDNGSALTGMRQRMHAYKQTARTRDLCDVVRELLRC